MATPSKSQVLAAASSGNAAELEAFLTANLPPDITLEDILAEAARSNQPSAVSLLLQHGAKVTFDVQQAAHQGGELEVYRLLVQHGLDVNCGFGHAGGPLTEAVLANDLEWAKLLLDAGADPEKAPLYSNQAAMAVAAANSVDIEIIRLLKQHGAQTGYKGLLALAVKAGNVPFVQFILGEGADPNEKVEESYFLPGETGTVLQLARKLGNADIVNILSDRAGES